MNPFYAGMIIVRKKFMAHRWKLTILAMTLAMACGNGGGGGMSSCNPFPEVSANCPTILNGTLYPAEESGIVLIRTESGFCSGVLLTNEWVLSAAHCSLTTIETTFGSVQMGSQHSDLKKVITHPLYQPGNLLADIKLGLLVNKFIMSGSDHGYNTKIFNGDYSQVQFVDAYGYGDYCIGTSDKQLRVGTALRVESFNAGLLELLPSAQQQLPYEGDSGGPSFIMESASEMEGQIRVLVGIHSGGTLRTASAVGPGTVKDFVSGIVPGY